MIAVTRIAGESYDLRTGEMLPKSLVLSNGVREYTLYVDDKTAHDVLVLLQESGAKPDLPIAIKERQDKPKAKPKPPVEAPAPRKQEVSELVETPLQETRQPALAVVEGVTEEEEEYLYGPEPGEEYNDPATGAASL